MVTSVTLNNSSGSPVILHETPVGNRRLTRATGLATISTPRAVVRPRPTAHGAIDETHWTGERLIVLEGFVLGADQAAAISELRTVQAAILQTLDSGAALLKWTEAGSAGLSLQSTVKLASDVDVEFVPGPDLLRYQVQLRAEDPRAYSQLLTTGTGSALAPTGGGMTFNRTFNITFTTGGVAGNVAVNNTGNRTTPPTFRMYGAWTNAQIMLAGTTKRIVLNGTVSAGDYLEVDVFNRTVKLNGSSNALYYLDAANTTWFDLPIGTSTIQTLAFAFDTTARCDVLYRSAYT